MATSFEEPIGPLADLSELLYVVALHQASLEYRKDICVNAEDISLFLISRYGVQCSPEIVQEFILKDVAGKRNDSITQEGPSAGSIAIDSESMAQDMSNFLSSRFSVSIKAEDLKDLMMEEKRSSRSKDGRQTIILEQQKEEMYQNSISPKGQEALLEDVPKMDLVELVAMLMIPEFRKLELVPEESDSVYRRFEFVANAMIHDLSSFGSAEEPTSLEITSSLVRGILLRYGETTLAHDENLIDEMVKAARTGLDDEDKAFFDKNTFAKAMTHDIEQYNADSEESITTNWEDVFGSPKKDSTIAELPVTDGISFLSKPTAATIDTAAHTYFCRVQMILNWMFFVFTKMYIGDTGQAYSSPFAVSVAGMLFVGLGSIGNSLKKSHFGLSLFAMAFLVFLVVYFPLTYGLIIPDQEPLVIMRLIALFLGFLTTLARLRLIVLACMKNADLSLVSFTALKSEALIKKASAMKVARIQENAFAVHEKVSDSGAIRSYFGKALSNFSKLDLQFRKRCIRKDLRTGRVVGEDGIFFSGRLLAGNVAQAILCFVIMGVGYNYTRYVRDNWIPLEERADRVAASLDFVISLVADAVSLQEAVDAFIKMFVLFLLRVLYFLNNAGLLRLDCVLLSTFLQGFCENALFDEEDDGEFVCSLFTGAPDQLCKSMDPIFRPTTPLGKAVPIDDLLSTINVTGLVSPVSRVVSQAMSNNIAAQANILYPRDKSMVVVPVAVAAGVATLCAMTITFLFLPSITATTLKLRTGVISSVCDPKKRNLYTFGANSGTYIFGSMFWGIIASSALVGGLVGFVLFLSMWQVTAFLIMKAVTLAIGISVTLFLKWLLKRTCRSQYYRGFYRNNPLRANLTELLNESFNFATSMAFAIIRMVKLLFLAAFFVGRIDTKFLDPNVNEYLGGLVQIDIFPDYFIADILSTEAHRHPYMERLGALYLYKLKYGPKFATRAGCTWRLLFVTALMPWLQKYRFESQDIKTAPSGTVHSA
ncbi:MAG: hypothetical protein SGBAC_009861 [Bacillariaceae sp.]